jgi:crotonobetainyl-CoA:carnitine CoA-transferase CaiB-like acyl-CoA transferase
MSPLLPPSPAPRDPRQPLGIHILDLTRLLPGRGHDAARHFLGAEVIKIESGSRRRSRALRAAAHGRRRRRDVYFCNVNRNKRSVLDLRRPATWRRSAGWRRDADVVVGFAPAPRRLGIGYGQLREAGRIDLLR